jgi:hypothetical protein
LGRAGKGKGLHLGAHEGSTQKISRENIKMIVQPNSDLGGKGGGEREREKKKRPVQCEFSVIFHTNRHSIISKQP